MNKISLKGRSFLTLKDFTKEEIKYLLALSSYLKTKKKIGIVGNLLEGKNIALIFEKNSTRTRCSFEVAATDEGAHTTFIGPNDSHMGKKESIEDTAKVLGRFYDGIEFRGYKQETVEILARDSGVPVWNGLTDIYHPTQILADLLTVTEYVDKSFDKIKFVYAGDARNNMGNSLMIGCAKLGINFVSLAPKELWPNKELLEEMRAVAQQSKGSITLTENIDDVEGADVIYTDVWVSMGEPDEIWEERIRDLTPYKVTAQVMKNAGEKAIFLHCLPAFHDLKTKIGKEMGERFNLTDMEVTDEVFESAQSKVFDEAENRMHTIKAVMVATLGEPEKE